MKHYLSFGGGVNSVALHLLMLREGFDFESIFVNHGTDWPETYEYFEYFQNWLKSNGHNPIIELIPIVKIKDKKWNSLIKYCEGRNIIPQQYPRWCTVDWKRKQVNKYIEKPCFMHLGIDASESKRAKINIEKGIENRWLLIEYEIDRDGCKELIKSYGLKIPPKSGCFICPFQRKNQWVELRTKHPDLFCKAQQLEKNSGRTFIKNIKLNDIVNENQIQLFEKDEYPPCQCML